MARKYTRKLEPINNQSELEEVIRSAGMWFIGTFMMEFVDSFECFGTKDKKNQFMDYFYNDYAERLGTKKEALAKVNSALRIIESGLVKEAMEYVMGACEGSECEAEAKTAAKELLESLESGAVKLPEFHK